MKTVTDKCVFNKKKNKRQLIKDRYAKQSFRQHLQNNMEHSISAMLNLAFINFTWQLSSGFLCDVIQKFHNIFLFSRGFANILKCFNVFKLLYHKRILVCFVHSLSWLITHLSKDSRIRKVFVVSHLKGCPFKLPFQQITEIKHKESFFAAWRNKKRKVNEYGQWW